MDIGKENVIAANGQDFDSPTLPCNDLTTSIMDRIYALYSESKQTVGAVLSGTISSMWVMLD